MPHSGLSSFIACLEAGDELLRIKSFVDPVLEITEITDRITKSDGKALLFENTGTGFPLLINAFGSAKRMSLALGRKDLDDAAGEITELFNHLTGPKQGFFDKIRSLPELIKVSGYLPKVKRGKGKCQQVIHRDPDLGIFPVLKCWPHDGGRFITLPVVHTVHPSTGRTNAGMYRMQVFDRKSTGMHWQRHKTGANHYEEWKKTGKRMPVTVTLGGDPVCTYAATAPLPENIDEYILAGFLRKKSINLVKCITNELMIPSDADIVIEGYVDPLEEMVSEGPFGDHTGFYSLSDFFPVFHVTCITHRVDAVYPATIVGIPPQEDAWFARATEKIFLAPVRLALQPEITDFHMPDAGVAHNLVVVKINKTYPGQGKKVISSLFGAGQMMFTKYLVVVSGEVDIRDYEGLLRNIFTNTDTSKDLMFTSGPMDVLDHASDICALGGKLGIDATVRLKEEIQEGISPRPVSENEILNILNNYPATIRSVNLLTGFPVAVIGINQSEDPEAFDKLADILSGRSVSGFLRLVMAVDSTVDVQDWFTVAWQVLGNTDPVRDIIILKGGTVLIDATIKAFSRKGFPRNWPEVVCSAEETIKVIDQKWDSLGAGSFIPSPSLKYLKLVHGTGPEISLPE